MVLSNKLTRGLVQNSGVITAQSSNQKNATFTNRNNSRLFKEDRGGSSSGSRNSRQNMQRYTQDLNYDSYLKQMSQADVSKAVEALDGIGTMNIGATPTKSISVTTKTFTQTVPRETLKNRRQKRAKKETQNDKTMERKDSVKRAPTDKDSKDSDDSLGRASEQTIKMSETVKLATNPA